MPFIVCLLTRLIRWMTYADCTCQRPAPFLDADHPPGCPHPLRRRR